MHLSIASLGFIVTLVALLTYSFCEWRERRAQRKIEWSGYGLPIFDIDVPMPPCKPTKGTRPQE